MKYSNVTAQKYADLGLCVQCGKSEPEDGAKRCAACKQKARDRQRAVKATEPDKVKAWQKKANANRRKSYKELGLCLTCGKQPASEGQTRCAACRKYHVKAGVLYQKRHPHKAGDYRRSVRSDVIAKYGGCCVCCQESQLEFLAIDQANGDGRERRQLFGKNKSRTYSWYLKLKREPKRDDLRVLCHNCNMAIGLYGRCPHQAHKDLP